MKKLTFLIAVLVGLQTQAQVVDTALLKSYPPSVIARVHQMATLVNLSKQQQLTVANLFKDEEDDIAAAILRNESPASIDNLRKLFKHDLHSILPASKLDSFYKAQAAPKALQRAEQTAKMLTYKYGNNNQTVNHFKTIYNWQETMLEFVANRYIDDSIRQTNLLAVLYTYDTLLNRYKEYGEANVYLNNQINTLQAVYPIDKHVIQNLVDSFYYQVINHKQKTTAQKFDNAFNQVFKSLDDSAYYKTLYQNQINQTYINSTTAILNTYIRTNNLSAYTIQQLFPIVAQREKSIALVQTILPTYNQERSTAIDAITQEAQPLIDSLIVRDANFEGTTQIDVAIRLATQLQLTTEQLETLNKLSNELNEKKLEFKNNNPEAEYDSRAYESEVLNKYLTEEQYTQVLVAKFGATANNMTKLDWEQVVKADLHLQYDSTNTKLELTNYHTAILVAFYRNAYDKEKQYSSVKMLQEVMPDVLRLLIDKWNYRTPYGDTPDTFFQW